MDLRCDVMSCTTAVYECREDEGNGLSPSNPSPVRLIITSNIRKKRHLNRPKRMVTFKLLPRIVSPKRGSTDSNDDECCDVVGDGCDLVVKLRERLLNVLRPLDVSRYRLFVNPLLSAQADMTSLRGNDVRDVMMSGESVRTSCELDDSGVGRTSDGSLKTDESSEHVRITFVPI